MDHGAEDGPRDVVAVGPRLLPGPGVLDARRRGEDSQSGDVDRQPLHQGVRPISPWFVVVGHDHHLGGAEPAYPGDQLTLEVEQKRMLRRMGLYLGVAKVDGVEVASAEILCAEGGR